MLALEQAISISWWIENKSINIQQKVKKIKLNTIKNYNLLTFTTTIDNLMETKLLLLALQIYMVKACIWLTLLCRWYMEVPVCEVLYLHQ